MTLFETLKELPKDLLAKPANLIVSAPQPSWWSELFKGWTTTEILGDNRIPDYSVPSPESLQWPTSVTPAD